VATALGVVIYIGAMQYIGGGTLYLAYLECTVGTLDALSCVV
jgi:hypothetical protein